ncbi:Chanoclavine-I aldehyde reductase fgaOx3 [Xylographa carneopallida]|nr:Chanoclavine-I aldehyde reductase fgaOx3 [Xylographa carneopallida]
MPSLSDPLQIGNCQLQHRLVMAPLTRYRADENHVPLPMVTEYYAQRASVPGTLLITEATVISPRASGYNHIPGIYSAAQIAQWKEVTAAVHAKGSYIYLQLWALGRAAHPDILAAEGYPYVSSSATPMSVESPTPRALTEEEIHAFIADYASAAKNAIAAGFDGVEIHAANGYLIDQFTQDTCNARTDAWGGSVANRARFGLEVARAVVAAVGPHRTGIRLSPFSTFQGMRMADPRPQFSVLVAGLRALGLSYLHVVESRISGNADMETTEKIDFLVEAWGATSPVLVAGGFTPESAKRAVEEEYPGEVAVVFGRYFISNPDLPFRVLRGVGLSKYDRGTFYKVGSREGYVDYPFSGEWEREKGEEKGRL